MSKREVEQELEELKQSLSPKLLEKLKRLGAAKPKDQKVAEDIKSEVMKSIKDQVRPIQMSEVSQVVSEAAVEMEKK